ncbi:nudix hydrolase 24, chloroplastic-like [Ornithorhynchus anatinus]|uniref:nudix hydrolase 24, chloroplastic-like n=1 Tax=Ornithorhynchus anatinus TaxID=9258 RepID=UPI0010A82170|nr:nudix hydrolase 24, chloroplastic-like [Ornithorhynchus anatinus]
MVAMAAGPGWAEGVRRLLRKFTSFRQPGSSLPDCLPLVVGEEAVGLVPPAVARELSGFPEVFSVWEEAPGRGCVRLSEALTSCAPRTAAVARVLAELRARDTFPALALWRDELYEVKLRFGDPPLLHVERAATPLLGLVQYGAHLNGYVLRDGELFMWLARRSLSKTTYPGLLDNLAAGGISSGLGVKETLIKECWEEARIHPELAAQALPTGCISYAYEDKLKGVVRECLFVFDLEMPADFVPTVGDGEVQEFYLWPIDKVREAVSSTNFKPNCALVVLDFLLRHGLLEPDHEPLYVELVSGLHQVP